MRSRQVQICAGFLAFLGAALAWWVDPRWVLLSGFVGAGLFTAGVTGFCVLAELLCRMPWNNVASVKCYEKNGFVKEGTQREAIIVVESSATQSSWAFCGQIGRSIYYWICCPCVRGMRIRVADVLDLYASGLSASEILKEMPDITQDDLTACLQYAARRVDHPVVKIA